MMKSAPVLLLTVFSAMAYAEPIYRCESSSGMLSFQDRICLEQPGEGGPNQSQPAGQVPPAVPADMAYFEAGEGGLRGSTYQQRAPQRLQARLSVRAQALHMRMLLKPANDRREAQYAKNRHRCQNAMRVAALCGKFAGRFSCDEQGFRPESIVEVSLPKPSVTDNGSAFKMEQCAMQAMKGRS